MLSGYMNELLLSLQDASAFLMVSPAYERAKWDGVGEAVRLNILRAGQQYKGAAVPPLTLSAYRQYGKDGDATVYNLAYQMRRDGLKALALAYCVRPEEETLQRLADYIWAICEESTWTLPQHNPHARGEETAALPNVLSPWIDAPAAQTAADLAVVCQLAEEDFMRELPGLSERIELEVRSRIIQPFLARNEMEYLCGPKSEALNALSGIMMAFLTFERDRKRRWQCMRKAWQLLDKLLMQLPPDGSAPGGLNAWQETAEPVTDCLTMACYATQGRVDARREMLVQLLCHYPVLCHIGDGWFVNPGESSMRPELDGVALYRIGVAVRDAALCDLGAHLHQQKPYAGEKNQPLIHMVFDALTRGRIEREKVRPPYRKQGYLSESQLFTARMAEDETGALAAAMTGGSNGTLGCHPDAGDILLFAGGDPVLVDAGFLKDTEFHNLPTIDGQGQEYGAQRRATDASARLEEPYAMASVNLASAYPSKVQTWQRTLMLNREDGGVQLMEVFDLRDRAQVEFHFLTPCPVSLGSGYAQLREVRLKWDAALEATVDEIPVRDQMAREMFGDTLYRLTLSVPEPVQHGQYTFVFHALRTFG